MVARSLQHATGRGVDHRANPARLGVERILKCHDNSLEDDSYQRSASEHRAVPTSPRVSLVARQTHCAITPTRTESSASRALMVSPAKQALESKHGQQSSGLHTRGYP